MSSRLVDSLGDNMLKILMVGAIVSIVVGVAQRGPKTGWIEGGTILVTFLLVTIIDAFNAIQCEKKIQKLRMNINQFEIQVFRDSAFDETINSEDLVVGDIYKFKAGMMIPADSIIIDVNSEFKNRVECNESDVTGLKTMQIKGKLDESNCNDDLSNVLYSKTYVVRGSGKAIVCAVGHRTQFGMPVEFEDDYQIRDEKSPFKDMLSAYSLKLGNYGNYLVIFLIALIPFRRFLEAKGIIECSIDNEDLLLGAGVNQCKMSTSYVEFITIFFQMIIVCLTLVIALIPEALPLAFGVCIRAYSKLDIISKDRNILFQKVKSIEAVGQANCICLEIDLNQEITDICLTLCYIKRCPKMQLIICSHRPLDQVKEFINHIEQCQKNFEGVKFPNIMTSDKFFQQLSDYDSQIKLYIEQANKYKDPESITKQRKKIKHVKKKKKDFINDIDVLTNLNSGEKYLLTQILNR